MAASAIKICSRKKGKANRPSESEKIVLRHYIRLGPGSQESRIYLRAKQLRCGKQIDRNFGIKSLLSQNWGACIYSKIWREKRRNSKLPNYVDQGIDCIRIDISWFRYDSRIRSLWMTSADSDDELRLAPGNNISDSTKRERLGSKLS